MNKTIKEHPDSYNGWTNYATWRVNLEILGDIDWSESDNATVEDLQEIVEDVVFGNDPESKQDLLKDSYANAFLSEVNYYEILQHVLEEINLHNEEA